MKWLELKAKVAQIERSKPALEALLKRVLELETKLSEGKKYARNFCILLAYFFVCLESKLARVDFLCINATVPKVTANITTIIKMLEAVLNSGTVAVGLGVRDGREESDKTDIEREPALATNISPLPES